MSKLKELQIYGHEEAKTEDGKALNKLIKLCYNDLNKSQTSDGVDLILNDYHIRAQKHLFKLDKPVTWFIERLEDVADDLRSRRPRSMSSTIVDLEREILKPNNHA